MEIELRHGYVKFVPEDEEETPTYILVCIDVMKKYFEEFRTIDEVIPELSMEYYNNFMVINCLPMKMLLSFKILVRFVTMDEFTSIDNIDEEVNLLLLLCRLANKEQIAKILNSFEVRSEVWVRLMDENFDANNFLCEEQKIKICKLLGKDYPDLDKTKYLSFYGIPYFENAPVYTCIDHEPHSHGDFPQMRIHDKKSKSYYQTLAFGDKVLLLNQQKYELYEKTKRKLYDSDYFFSSESSSDDNNDDESTSDTSRRIIKLQREKIRGLKINNYVMDVVDVHFSDKITPMQLVESTGFNRSQIFFRKYAADYKQLQICTSKNDYDLVMDKAYHAFKESHIYKPPTNTDFEQFVQGEQNITSEYEYKYEYKISSDDDWYP